MCVGRQEERERGGEETVNTNSKINANTVTFMTDLQSVNEFSAFRQNIHHVGVHNSVRFAMALCKGQHFYKGKRLLSFSFSLGKRLDGTETQNTVNTIC